MFNRLVTSGEYILYRKAIWLYLFLLIFEGALRKWFLPALATPLLVVRDPIVIWLVLVGLQKKWLNNGYVIAMIAAGTVSLLLTLTIGHQNLLTAFFGWRIYFFYFPFIFVIGKVLTRDDLLKMGRFVLYLSIPMTILIVMQFYSPQSAWVNRGVGGDMEGAGFGGALGYFRPPGTFSFTSGYTTFQLVVACFLAYYLLANKTLERSRQVKPWSLWIVLMCYIISIPYSISRGLFFQTAVVLAFLLLSGLWYKKFNRKMVSLSLLIALAVGVILLTGIADESYKAFSARYEDANEAEGGVAKGVIGNRYIGSLIYGLYNDNAQFLGSGLGLGTNVGAKIAGSRVFFYGEGEWGRIIGECGLLLGWVIIAVRCLFSWAVFKNAFRRLQKRQDLLPWILSSGMLLIVPQGQMGTPTNLGVLVFMGGIALAAVNHRENYQD
ncbi:MAG: hypothetical protein LBE13_20685 [Bacteroidales bacterium]|jgi:hypothetical protein|nr:hypothetical protein [Bacteroidales bacterium]